MHKQHLDIADMPADFICSETKSWNFSFMDREGSTGRRWQRGCAKTVINSPQETLRNHSVKGEDISDPPFSPTP